jgi:hypothetical protein
MEIIIYPPYNSYYANFYLGGLIGKFGKKSISFSKKPFKNLKNRGCNFDFVIESHNKKNTLFNRLQRF